MIDFEHVTKIYKRSDKPALEDIDFHVADGEFVFLVGHSGAGKSTLLKLILREELPTEGRVLVDGKDVARLRRGKVPYLRRQMGIIFQDFRLIPTMTVYENIAFAMHVTNIGKKDIKERVNYMLELVHLEDKAKVYPEFLSGGEQQRVAVARALAHSPRLVIADEPTGNIDPEMSLEMMELLERVSEMGITVLVVTHEHELVRRFNGGEASVFLISLRAGGTGLNLTAADIVIHYDPWWNVAAQNQATDRAYRIGQQNPVQVYKLIAQDTIEEKIVELQQAKQSLADTVTGTADGAILSMRPDELLQLLEGSER